MGLGGSDNPARGKEVRPGRGCPAFLGEQKHEQAPNARIRRAGDGTGDSVLKQRFPGKAPPKGKGANKRLFVDSAPRAEPTPAHLTPKVAPERTRR